MKHKFFIQDEFYYVKDGWSMFRYGYEVKWIADAYDLPNIISGLSSSNRFFYNNIAPEPYSLDYWSLHPPVGKWIIGLGVQLFGMDNPLGWRFGVVLAGTIIIGLSMWLAYQVSAGGKLATILAGLFVAFDGFNVSMSTVSMVDIFLAMFALLATNLTLLFVKKNELWGFRSKTIIVLLIGVTVGLASGVKWSGVFTILPLGVYLLYKFITTKDRIKPVWFVFSASVGLIASYVLSFSGWFLNAPEGLKTNNVSTVFSNWLGLHVDNFNSAYIFSGASHIKSTPSEWVLASFPSMFRSPSLEGIIVLYTIPNLVLWFTGWFSMAAMIFLAIFKRKINWMHAIIILSVFFHILPWLFNTERVIYQWYSIVFAPLVLISAALLVARVYKIYKSIFYSFLTLSVFVGFVFMPVNVGFDSREANIHEIYSHSYLQNWTDFTLQYGLRDRLNTAMYFRPDIEFQQVEGYELIYFKEGWRFIKITHKNSDAYRFGEKVDTSDFQDFDIWQAEHPHFELVKHDGVYYLKFYSV